MPILAQNFRYALRLMAKNPGFSIVVIATLALTVALSTTVFSVLEAVFLRPLPYKQPQRIVAVNTVSPQGYGQPASYPEFVDWRRDVRSFSALAAYNAYGSVNFERDAASIALHAVSASDNFFDVFGVKPVLGRTFINGEEQPGRNFVVVLSHEVWRNQFGGRADVLGKKVKLDGQPYTVIGVMPPGFRFPINRTDTVYRPLRMTENQRKGRGNHWLPTVARLRDGVTQASAQAEMQSVLNQLGRAYPDTNGRRVKLQDLLSFTIGKTDSALHLLIYAVLALLAIGCVNIAGLLFARGVRLSREVAVRSVLGAGRGTLVGQFLMENAVYAVAGGIGGAALAYGLVGATRTLLSAALSRGTEVEVNGTALVASLFLAMLTSLLAGLLPALRLSGTSVNAALRTGSRAGADRGQHRLRGAFVVTQIALALVLLMTDGLLLRALSGLLHANLGFEPDHILAAEIDLSPGSYEKRDVLANFYGPLLERVKAIPDVKEAGLIQLVPVQEYGWNSDVHIAGQPPSPPNEERLAEYRLVTPGYYAVFGQKLLRGRTLDMKLDTPTSQRVFVINERFVKRFIPEGKDPIEQRIDSEDNAQIIGVVSDIRQNIYEPPLAEMAIPISQIPAQMRLQYIPAMNLVLKTTGKPEAVIGDLRRIMHELDPTLPFRAPKSMKTIIADALTFERLENWLFGTFAALAVLLATLGLYGLISHEVELSTRDIGLRMALGATRARILALVYRRVGVMLFTGLILGGFVAWAAAKLITSVAISGFDRSAGTISAVVLAFILIALLAAALPARRAVTIEPVEALRAD
jgi:predicted permease